MSDSDFTQGFHAGCSEAARMLREAANDHTQVAEESRKVLEKQANELAAAILLSWANGIEMTANRVASGKSDPTALHVAAASALRFLRNQDGAGFGTTKMEGSEFYMWASCIASDLDSALVGDRP